MIEKSTKELQKLCDIASAAHAKIQQDFKHINPIVGVNKKMRDSGIPVDAMTIDCLKTDKRIILILHDHELDVLRYQFSFRNKDPDQEFEQIPFETMTIEKLYEWIKGYFSENAN